MLGGLSLFREVAVFRPCTYRSRRDLRQPPERAVIEFIMPGLNGLRLNIHKTGLFEMSFELTRITDASSQSETPLVDHVLPFDNSLVFRQARRCL